MSKYIILLVFVTFFTNVLYGQGNDSAIDYLHHIDYDKNRRVMLFKTEYKDIISGETSNYISKGISQAIYRSSLVEYDKLVLVEKPDSQYDFEAKDMIFHKGVTYMAYWDVGKLDFQEYEVKGKVKTRINLVSNFRITDIITGSVFLNKAINYNGDIDGAINKYQYKTGLTEMFKYVIKSINKVLIDKIPNVAIIKEINESKKEKAKKVILNFQSKDFKRWRLYVNIVDKEIEKEGKIHYVFKTIGHIKYKKKLNRNAHIYKVKKGGKAIYKAFNEKKKLFVTAVEIGN